MLDYAIRALNPQDIPNILALWQTAGLPHRPRGRDSVAELKRQMADDHIVFIGVFEGENMVAVVLANWEGRKGWINRLAVYPHHRRSGLGARLIAEAEKALKKMGARIVATLIENWNQPSLALFQREGYKLHKDIYYLCKREDEEV
jgi:ribosomal protein S18 acetylase RimI-like enzyme